MKIQTSVLLKKSAGVLHYYESRIGNELQIITNVQMFEYGKTLFNQAFVS